MSYQKAVEQFHAHRFREALELFENALRSTLSQDELLSSYYYALVICKKLELQDKHQELEEKFIQFLSQHKLYRQLNEEIKDRDTLDGLSSKALGCAWEAALEVGEIERALAISKILLRHYFETKNFTRGLEVIKKLRSKVKTDAAIATLCVHFSMMKGDGEAAAEELSSSWAHKLLSIDQIRDIIFSLNNELLMRTSLASHWIVYYCRLEEYERESVDSLKNRKKKMNLLYQAFLYYPLFPPFIAGLVSYAVIYKRKKIYESLRQYCRTQKIDWKKHKRLYAEVQSHFAADYQFEEDAPLPTMEEELVDMATDLFSESAISNKGEVEQKRKMERAVEFLREIGEESKASQLSAKLEGEKKNNESEMTIEDNRNSFSEIIDDLQKSMEYFAARIHEEVDITPHDEDNGDSRILGYIAKGGVEVNSQNYKDMAIALTEMGMYKSALAVMERFPSDARKFWSLEQRIEFRYLKIEILRRTGDLGEALALVKEMLDTWALNREELICFHYLAAELYKENNILERALYHYQTVFALDPKYRMVEQRISQIVEA